MRAELFGFNMILLRKKVLTAMMDESAVLYLIYISFKKFAGQLMTIPLLHSFSGRQGE